MYIPMYIPTYFLYRQERGEISSPSFFYFSISASDAHSLADSKIFEDPRVCTEPNVGK
jgi:hypothetical protein